MFYRLYVLSRMDGYPVDRVEKSNCKRSLRTVNQPHPWLKFKQKLSICLKLSKYLVYA